MNTIANLIVEFLEAQNVRHVWGVPGESYLDVLDALHDSNISFLNTRHEGTASMAAEAEGKLTRTPGIAFVTRGPGAMNAAHGLHIAEHDSSPMLLFIGQIPKSHYGRGAFQEMDYHAVFGSIARDVITLDNAERAADDLRRGWETAIEGRGGPVVFVMPEDCFKLTTTTTHASNHVERKTIYPSAQGIKTTVEKLLKAKSPIIIAGGTPFDQDGYDILGEFSELLDLPVAVSFRRQMYFDHSHSCYAGDLGLGANPALLDRVENADVVILLGAEMEEVPSQGYQLLQNANHEQYIVQVGMPSKRTRWLNSSNAIVSDPDQFIIALHAEILNHNQDNLPRFDGSECHKRWIKWSTPTTKEDNDSALHLDQIMHDIADMVPLNAIITNGAGNYAGWLHRFFPFTRFGSQLAPVSGSMGYGLPAALAAQKARPKHLVIAMAGDGCFQMHGQEITTAAELGLSIIIIVFNNGKYGTIRMHQEHHFPDRVSGTDLHNPDFVSFCQACGGDGAQVANRPEFLRAFQRAMQSKKPYLIELMCDPDQISPTMHLTTNEDS